MAPPRRTLALEAALVALLASNGVYFALSGSASKTVDSAAWLALLVLFLAETRFPHIVNTPRRRLAVRTSRLVAAAGVFVAACAYILEGNRLDAANNALWIAVVLLLETELRWPGAIVRARRAFLVMAIALYGGLAVLVIAWIARGEWIDAWDAALWLAAFALVELDVMGGNAS